MSIVKKLVRFFKPNSKKSKTNSKNSISTFCHEFSELEKYRRWLVGTFMFLELYVEDGNVSEAVKILKFHQREIMALKKKFDAHYKKLFPFIDSVDFPQMAMDVAALRLKNIPRDAAEKDAYVKFVRKTFLQQSDNYKRYIAESKYRTAQTKNIFSAVDDAWEKYSYIKSTLVQMTCISDTQNEGSVKETDSL